MTRGPLVRWPTTVMVKPKRSRRNQIAHGETKQLTEKPKSSRQNQIAHGKTKMLTTKPNSSRQNQKAHGKTKQLTAKPNSSKKLSAKPKSSRQNQIAHGKPKDSWKNQKTRGKIKKPKNGCALRRKRAFSTSISKFVSFCLCS